MPNDDSPADAATTPRQLESIGFRRCGYWRLGEQRIEYTLSDGENDMRVLYAFVSQEAVLYIGKTVRSLRERMYQYQNPGRTQYTNIRGHEHIRQMLEHGLCVDIYAFSDPGHIRHAGILVNLAAGLEDSLITTFKPQWNVAGK
jgi:hypothetical protein